MVNKIIEKITDPYSLISSLGVRGLFNWMSDEKYLKMLWRLKFHKSLNLDNPQTFNEKLQWLKIHDRKPIYTTMADRIIAEKYMEDSQDKELRDYKFYCFDGKVHALLLVTNRHGKGKMYFDYFDSEFSHLNLTNHWHSNAPVTPRKPYSFDTMIELAKILSTGIPHVRVDFYEMNGRVYFGEMTFYNNSGFLKIHPDDWEIEWGNLIRLPQ